MSNESANSPAVAWNEFSALERNLRISRGLIFLLARSATSSETIPPASKDGDAVHELAEQITTMVDESYNAAFAASHRAQRAS